MKPAEVGGVAAGSSVGALTIIGVVAFVVMKKRKQNARDEAYGEDTKKKIKSRNENTKPSGLNMDKIMGENESNIDVGGFEANIGAASAKISQLTTSLSLSASSPDEDVDDLDESIYAPKLEDPNESLFAAQNNSASCDQMATSHYHIVNE
jgi:hypothetical protein